MAKWPVRWVVFVAFVCRLSRSCLVADAFQQLKKMPPPPEPENSHIIAKEALRIHPSHRSNKTVLNHVHSRFLAAIWDKTQELRDSPTFHGLLGAKAEIAKLKKELEKVKKSGVQAARKNLETKEAERDTLRRDMDPLWKGLELMILEALTQPDEILFGKLGANKQLNARLVSTIIRLVNINEPNHSLVKTILRLFGAYPAVKPSDLETWKIASIKAKGDGEIESLVEDLTRKAEQNRDIDSPTPEMDTTSGAKKAAKSAGKSASASSTAKRGREEEQNSDGNGRSTKKQATEVPASGASNGTRPADLASRVQPVSAKAPPKSSEASTSALPLASVAPPPVKRALKLPGKVRVPSKSIAKAEPPKVEPPKLLTKQEPPAAKATLVTPSTKGDMAKSGPSKAPSSRPAAQVSDQAKVKVAKSKAPEPPQPSRFASIMAEITEDRKIEVSEPPPEAPPPANEKEEDRKRRLRKEERRRLGLKVTFKSDDRLVETREFTRDPEEIREGAAFRDVKSDKDKMEGMALKKSHAGELRPWDEPSAIYFDVIPLAKREQTYITRGGTITFHTEQQKFMEDRETRELMVIYTDPADIPPTPRSPHYEPTLDYDDQTAEVVLPMTAEYDEIRLRERDRVQWGLRRAIEAALGRLETQSRPDYTDFTKILKNVNSIADTYTGAAAAFKPDTRSIPVPISAEQRDQQTYELLMSDRVRNYQDPDPYNPARPKTVRRHDYDPGFQPTADYVENVFAQFMGSQPAQPVVANPTPAPAPAPQAQPAVDYSAAWAAYYAQQQPQQQQAWYASQQQSAYTQPTNPYLPPQAAQPAASQSQSIDSILSVLGNASISGQSQPQPQPPAADTSQIHALMAALAGSQPQTQPTVAAPAAAAQNVDWVSSILSQLGSGQSGTAVANPAVSMPGYPYDQAQAQANVSSHQASYGTYGQGNYGQSHQERDNYSNSNGRNRERERDGGRDRERHGTRGGGGNGSWGAKSQSDVPDHLRGVNRSLIGTKPCTFYAKGQCAKGDKCTFRHD